MRSSSLLSGWREGFYFFSGPEWVTYSSGHISAHFLLSCVIDVHEEGRRVSPVKAGKMSLYPSTSELCYLGMLH